MNNYIQILNDNTGLTTTASYIELDTSVSVPITFAVSDIRDVTTRTGTFSKSITVPGTKLNNQVLGQLFDVNTASTTSTFDVNRKVLCAVVQEGTVVLDNASLQMISVDKVNRGQQDNGKIFYTLLIKDTVGDFFSKIGQLSLRDLKYNELKHIKTGSNILASFSNTYKEGYKYTLVKPSVGLPSQYDITDLNPGVYVRTYLDKIFANAGYSYTWPTSTQSLLNKLLMPYSGDKPKATMDYLDSISSKAYGTTGSNVQIVTADESNAATQGRLKYNNITYNYTGGLTASTNYTPFTNPWPMSGSDSLQYDVNVSYKISVVNPNNVAAENTSANARIQAMIAIGTTVSGASSVITGSNAAMSIVTAYNTTTIDTANSTFLKLQPFMPLAASSTTQLCTGAAQFTVYANNIDVNQITFLCAYTKYTNDWFVGSGPWSQPGTLTPLNSQPFYVLQVDSINVRIRPSTEHSAGFNDPVIFTGATSSSTSYVPDMKQSDFLKSLFNMFNIYAVPDKANPRALQLYHRDEFYDNGTIKDWSSKTSLSSNREIKFLPEVTSKTLTLSYKKSEDLYNKTYTTATGKSYGQMKYIFDNQFVTNYETRELSFGPAPFIKTSFGAYVDAVEAGKSVNQRIVIDNGPTACSTFSIRNYGSTGSFGTGPIGPYNAVGSTYSPCIHFLGTSNPSADLNFGICDYYFDNTFGKVTPNTLGNLYWRRTVSQINNGILYTVDVDLTPGDIANLSLSDKIFLEGQYWSINKVIDYDANDRKLTRVELLRADDLSTPFYSDQTGSTSGTSSNGSSGAMSGNMLAQGSGTSTVGSSFQGVMNAPYSLASQNVTNAIVASNTPVNVSQNGVYTSALVLKNHDLTAQLDTRKYYANVTTTTGNLVVNFCNNFLDGDVTMTKTDVGQYIFSSDSPVFAGNFYGTVTNSYADGSFSVFNKIDDYRVELIIHDKSDGPHDILENANIILEVMAPQYIYRSGPTLLRTLQALNSAGTQYNVDSILGTDFTIFNDLFAPIWYDNTYSHYHNRFFAVGNYTGNGMLLSVSPYEDVPTLTIIGSYPLRCVAVSDTGRIVALGYDGTHTYILYSDDGVTWNTGTANLHGDPRSVTYDSSIGTFVAVCDNSSTAKYLLKSTNGSTWNEYTGLSTKCQAIATDNGGRFVVTTDRNIWYGDATTWTIGATVSASSVAYSPELGFFAVTANEYSGTTKHILTGTTSTWTVRTAPDSTYRDICWTSYKKFVATTDTTQFVQSSDGITWENINVPLACGTIASM